MSIIRISTRYAKALLDTANEQKALDTVYGDVKSVLAHMAENRELEMLFLSPIIPADKKLASVDAIYKGKLQDLSIQFLKLTIRKGREIHLIHILNQFIKEYNAFNNKVAGTLTTAVAINDALKDKIVASVKAQINNDIEVVTAVDESLIGGYIFELEDQMIDASVKHQLNQIAHVFSK